MNKSNMGISTISIIIVSYNTKDLIQDCIQSIIDKTESIDYEIIVVDNASTDGTQEIICSNFPQIKFIANKTNIGFGAANNIGIKQAAGKYIFLLNPDTVLTNNAIKLFYDFMEDPKHKNIWCCGGKVFSYQKHLEISHGNFPSLTQIIFEFGLHKIFPIFYQKHLSTTNFATFEQPTEVDYISGANMFIRKSVLIQYGLFDEDFFLYYEETELSFRIKQKGYKAILLPTAHIVHIHGQSSKKMIPDEKLKIIESSKYLFFQKSYGTLSMTIANILYILKYLLLLIKTRDKVFKKYLIFSLNFLFDFPKYKKNKLVP